MTDTVTTCEKLLTEMLLELSQSGVVMEDERIGYVEIQVDRETWLALQVWAKKQFSAKAKEPSA